MPGMELSTLHTFNPSKSLIWCAPSQPPFYRWVDSGVKSLIDFPEFSLEVSDSQNAFHHGQPFPQHLQLSAYFIDITRRRSHNDPCEDRGTEWGDVSPTQWMPRIASNHQSLGERHGTDFPLEPPKEPRCQHLDFGLLASGAIGRINSCFLLATKFLVICYGGPRELIPTCRVMEWALN